MKKALFHICVKDAFLLHVMRHGVLSEKRCLQPDFGADPFAFGMGSVGRVVAAASAAELWPEVGGLDLVERMDLAPGLVTYCAGDVDF